MSRTPAPRHLVALLDEVVQAMDEARTAPAMDAVAPLARARGLLDEALDEAMANALLDGSSIRSVALGAGLAPNTLPPRLARTVLLSGYADAEGRVGAKGVDRARWDRAQSVDSPQPAGKEPLRFRRRQS